MVDNRIASKEGEGARMNGSGDKIILQFALEFIFQFAIDIVVNGVIGIKVKGIIIILIVVAKIVAIVVAIDLTLVGGVAEPLERMWWNTIDVGGESGGELGS